MATQNNNLIVSDSHALMEKNLEMMGDFFNQEISTLKTGNFGYLNSITASIGKNGNFHRSSLYNEIFLNTASMPQSIINFANQFNYSIPDAIPSKAAVAFTMERAILERKASEGAGSFIIPRTDVFNFSGQVFALPYSIKIETNNGVILASYDLDQVAVRPELEMIYRSNPYIKTWSNTDANGNVFVTFLLDVYQYDFEYKVFEVMSKNTVDQILFPFKFTNQLVDFRVKYNGEYIDKYFDPNIIPDDERYVYWDKTGDDTLQIFFSTIDRRFRPKFGAKIEIEAYTSNGTQGNFDFTGNVTFAFSDQSLSRELVLVEVFTQPSGGKDAQSLMETKQELLKYQRTQNTLNTDYDIEQYFDGIAKNYFARGSKVEFKKTRDDVIDRTYTAFAMLRDSKGAVIPTNTIDFEIPYSDLEANEFRLPAGTMIIHDKVTDSIRPLRSDEFPDEFLSTPNSFVYSLPYLLETKLSPIVRMNYYDLHTDLVQGLLYYPNSEAKTGREFLVNNFSIKRNAISETTYKIETQVNVSGEQIDPIRDISVIMLIKDGERILGHKLLQYNSARGTYTADIETDDEFNEYGWLRLNGFTNYEEELDYIEVKEKIDVEFGIFFRTGSSFSAEYSYEALNEPDIRNKRQVVTLKSPGKVQFFKNIGGTVRSDAFINDSGSVLFESVPVVASRYFFNPERNKELMNALEKYRLVLENNVVRLGNSTHLNFKFFNTYGLSYLYDTPYVNLKLEVGVKLHGNYSSNLDEQIRREILQYILDSNSTDSKRLVMTNMIYHIKTKIPQIDYMEFYTLNDMPRQTINYLYGDDIGTTKQLINTPEFLSIDVVQPSLGEPEARNSIKIRYI